MRIEVDPSELRYVAGVIQREGSVSVDLLRSLRLRADSVRGGWEGHTRRQFDEAFAELGRDVDQYASHLHALGADLIRLAEYYEELERELARRLAEAARAQSST
ncbi:MAG: hypothetical protein K0R39_3184 [Symbiobacteriaceae bacterium]|jgi:WXG100 family type VII secretion target|nr:hypothetical protein [Symbiobacteriaceae bacterium]